MARAFWKNRPWLRKWGWNRRAVTGTFPPMQHHLYPVPYFRQKLCEERRRAERSHKPLLVMVLDAERAAEPGEAEALTEYLGDGINTLIRGTDICGLLKEGGLVGVILTEVEAEKVEIAQRAVAKKTREKLAAILDEKTATLIAISFRIYSHEGGDIDLIFYPELTVHRQVGGEIMKRSLDVVGSLIGLLLFSPFFTLLPVLIKLGSKGPVFYRQERIGRNGRKFKMIKFRSMYLDSDDVIHREYVRKLIAGDERGGNAPQGIYKIQGDPRVTPIGRFIRKYSLDELPQFINVLKGDMSLVGPRPPIKYEVQHYRAWQRNRLIGKRPGLTGLWQVTGRSRTSFDEMVRLDLRYLHGWSIMLDLKILMRTPVAVLKCKGAY